MKHGFPFFSFKILQEKNCEILQGSNFQDAGESVLWCDVSETLWGLINICIITRGYSFSSLSWRWKWLVHLVALL